MSDDEAEAITNLGAVVAAQQAEIERLREWKRKAGENGTELAAQLLDARTRAEQAEAEVGRLQVMVAAFNNGMPAMTTKDVAVENATLRAQIAAMQAAMVEAVEIINRVAGYKNAGAAINDLFAPFLQPGDV